MLGQTFKIGERVQVSGKHWLRANHLGTVVEYAPRRVGIELVEFDEKFPGGGFADGGRLYIDHAELIPLKRVRRGKAA